MEGIRIQKCPICGGNELKLEMLVKDHSITGEEFEIVKCIDCGLGITQDQPLLKDIGKYYASEDYISHSDTSRGLINSLYHRVRSFMLGQKQKLVEKYHKSGRLLDIGAGTGYFINHMRSTGWEISGLEPDESARKVAKDQFGLELKDISEISDFADHSFDVITMWHVLEHVHDLPGQFGEISRLLKKDGTLVIAVPNPTSSDAKKYGSYWAGYDVPRHLWHFTPESMERLFNRQGFELTEIRGMPFDAFYVSLLSEKYRQNNIGLVSGGIAGVATNLKALSNKTNASSLIYVGHLR